MIAVLAFGLTDAHAVADSRASQHYGLAMADAVMYCLAQEFSATIWTRNVNYQGLPGVELHPRL